MVKAGYGRASACLKYHELFLGQVAPVVLPASHSVEISTVVKETVL